MRRHENLVEVRYKKKTQNWRTSIYISNQLAWIFNIIYKWGHCIGDDRWCEFSKYKMTKHFTIQLPSGLSNIIIIYINLKEFTFNHHFASIIILWISKQAVRKACIDNFFLNSLKSYANLIFGVESKTLIQSYSFIFDDQ